MHAYRTYGQIIFTIKEQREPLLTLSLFQDLLAATLTDNGSLFLTNIESGEVRRVGDDGTGGQVTVLTTARVDWYAPSLCLVSTSRPIGYV